MDAAERRALIDTYRDGVAEVDKVLAGASDADLDRRPAPDEWTAREVAHHLADSETMSTIRLRRLLAEDGPLIQAYDETEFARRLHYDRPVDLSVAVFGAVRAELAHLRRLRLPSILHWDHNHFVVLAKIVRGGAIIRSELQDKPT